MKKNRIAVFLGHPAHYHMFKHLVATMEDRGVEVDYVIKRKDIVEQLVQADGHRYFVVRRRQRGGGGRLALAWALVSMDLNMCAYLLRRRPRVVIGTYAPVLSHCLGVPFVVCCEDDTAVVPHFARTSYPYADAILAPVYCDGGKWDCKMTKYPGFQKLAYLHPLRFRPDIRVVEQARRGSDKPYVLVRLSGLSAHHDGGIRGMTDSLLSSLVEEVERRGYELYISSERQLPEQFERYRLRIDPMNIHHWMSFATLYVGDSQSMAVEAAMLGTPSVRYSDFAHRIGVLNVLEERYKLTTSVPADQPEQLLATVGELLDIPNCREVYRQRWQTMIDEQVDVTAFFIGEIEKYLCTTSRQSNIPS